VPINGKNMADIKKSAAYVPQHEETENFWYEIYQWLILDGEQYILHYTATKQLICIYKMLYLYAE
jgi:hypothetical protein